MPMGRPQGTRGLVEPFGYGKAWDEIVPGASPAAGANFSLKVPGQYSSRVLSAVFTLVTDANAGDRAVTLDFATPEGLVWSKNGIAVVVPASKTAVFSGQIDRSHGEQATGTAYFFPISDLFIDPGNLIQINVAGKQATDQLSSITFVLERFPTGSRGYPEGAVQSPARRR